MKQPSAKHGFRKETATCVQRFDDSQILQFTLLIALCYVLHRYTSQEIHRWQLYFVIVFCISRKSNILVLKKMTETTQSTEKKRETCTVKCTRLNLILSVLWVFRFVNTTYSLMFRPPCDFLRHTVALTRKWSFRRFTYGTLKQCRSLSLCAFPRAYAPERSLRSGHFLLDHTTSRSVLTVDRLTLKQPRYVLGLPLSLQSVYLPG